MNQSGARVAFYPLIAAGVVGVVGFLSGFFLPIILSPDANQGPLLGIFITGPGGAVLGLGVGLVAALLRLERTAFVVSTSATAAAVAAGTLAFSFPEPMQLGTVVEAEVVRCETADRYVPAAVAEWKRQIAGGWVRSVRSGWEEAIPSVLAKDPGVVLVVRVKRWFNVWEHRKPWNRGRISRRENSSRGGTSSYYLRGAAPDCSSALPTALRFTPQSDYTLPAPPDNAAGLLRLSAIGEVPPRLERALVTAE